MLLDYLNTTFIFYSFAEKDKENARVLLGAGLGECDLLLC